MPKINLSIESDIGDSHFSIGDRVTFIDDLDDIWIITGAKLEADKECKLNWQYSLNKTFSCSYHEYCWFTAKELRLAQFN